MRALIRDIILPVMVALTLAFVIQEAVAKPYEIPTPSMWPTIRSNDRIIANRVVYRFRDPARGDIIVFEPTQTARNSCGGNDAATKDVPFVKRVIGIPGDTVSVHNGLTFVNGKPFVVPIIASPQYRAQLTPVYTMAPLKVPPGDLFVLGDNRNESCDSHVWPDHFAHVSAVIGQAEVIYWPLNHLGFLS